MFVTDPLWLLKTEQRIKFYNLFHYNVNFDFKTH